MRALFNMFNGHISRCLQVYSCCRIVALTSQKRQLYTFYYLLGMMKCVFTITCLIVGSMHRFQKICYVIIVFILIAAQLTVCSTSSKYTNILEITKKTFLKRHVFVFFCIIHAVIVFIYVEGSYQQSQAVCNSHEINTELNLMHASIFKHTCIYRLLHGIFHIIPFISPRS